MRPRPLPAASVTSGYNERDASRSLPSACGPRPRHTVSEAFDSGRFGKTVWLTNHAIESMAKRNVTLAEVKRLIEDGQYRAREESHGWIFYHFESRPDNLVCAAVSTDQAIIVKTVMVNWRERDKP